STKNCTIAARGIPPLSLRRPRFATERFSLLHRLREHLSMPAEHPLTPRSCRVSLGISLISRDCSIILGVFSSQNGPDAGPSWSVRDRAPADPAACPGRYAGECVQPSALSRCSFVPCDSAGYFVQPHCWSPAGVCHPGTSAPSPSSGWKACPEPGPAACTGSRVPVAEPVEPAPSPSGSGGRTIGRPPP